MNFNDGRDESSIEASFGDFFSSPSEREKSLIRRETAFLVFCLVLMFFLSSLLRTLLMGAGTLINKDLCYNDVFKESVVLVSYAVSMTVPFSLFGAYTRIPVEKALKNRKTPLPLTLACLFTALGVSVVGMFSSMAVTFILARLGLIFETSFSYIPSGAAAFTVYFLNMTIVPALLEEVAFRGFVLQSLRRFGDGFALFASSLLFALIHVNPGRFPHTFIMGLVIGYFVLFTGSLKTGVIIHFVYNFILTSLQVAADAGLGDSAFMNTAGQIAMLMLAFPALFYLLKNYHGMFTLRQGRNVNPASENIRTFLKCRGMIMFYVLIFIMGMGELMVL